MPQLPFTFRGAGRRRNDETEAPEPDRRADRPEAGSRPDSAPSANAGPRRWTVSELGLALRQHVEGGFKDVWVEGEIRGRKIQPSSGHAYFDLVDRRSKLSVFMPAMYVRRLAFPLEDGAHVLLRGEASVFEARGQLQLRAKRLEPVGEGALLVALRARIAKLEAEGLTAPARKRALPRWPRRVGVVTSRSGAAFRDVWRTALRRDAGLHMILAPTAVQGSGAVEGLVRALRALDRHRCDVILLVRGGGSLEDLKAFNEEVVARAVAACKAPVVTGVGHETDTTLVDLVADWRASTPTGAAARAVPERAEMARAVAHLRLRMERAIRARWLRCDRDLAARRDRLQPPTPQLHRAQQLLDSGEVRLQGALARAIEARRARGSALQARLDAAQPAASLRRRRARLGALELRLARAVERVPRRSRARHSVLEARLKAGAARVVDAAGHRQVDVVRRLAPALRRSLDGARGRFEARVAALEALSPLSVLARGYAVVRHEGKVVRSSGEVRAGQRLDVRVSEGRFFAEVLPDED